jgi:hypothetical protein
MDVEQPYQTKHVDHENHGEVKIGAVTTAAWDRIRLVSEFADHQIIDIDHPSIDSGIERSLNFQQYIFRTFDRCTEDRAIR